MNGLAGDTPLNDGPGESRDFVDRMLELQPQLQRALDFSLPEEVSRELGSVTLHQLEALACLPADGTTMRFFAAAVGISGAAATALANRMIKQGLAERRDDPSDRRTVWLSPTPRALTVLDSFRRWQRETMAATLRRLEPNQISTFLEVLSVLAEVPSTPEVPQA